MTDYIDIHSTHAQYRDAVRAADDIADWTAAPAGIIRTVVDAMTMEIQYVAASWEALVAWPDDDAVLRFCWAGSDKLPPRDYHARQDELRQLMWAHRVGDARTIEDALESQTVGMARRSAVLA